MYELADNNNIPHKKSERDSSQLGFKLEPGWRSHAQNPLSRRLEREVSRFGLFVRIIGLCQFNPYALLYYLLQHTFTPSYLETTEKNA